MFFLRRSKKFKKDFKRLLKNSEFHLEKLQEVLTVIVGGQKLNAKYCAHALSGKYRGCFECHVQPDILLIYEIDDKEMVVDLLRLGSHAELFK